MSRAASSAASSEEGPVLLPLWRLLAPAFAGTFVLIMALTPRNEQLSIATRARTDRFLEAVAGNQNYAAYLTGGLHSEQNGPAAETLEWTFRLASTSTMAPLPAAATNTLMH